MLRLYCSVGSGFTIHRDLTMQDGYVIDRHLLYRGHVCILVKLELSMICYGKKYIYQN